MKEKLRGFLGFLGLVEDEYGEYGPGNVPRPFSEQPGDPAPEWAPAPAPANAPASRTFLTQPAAPSPYRAPAPAPRRTTSISVLEGANGSTRVRPMPTPNAARGASSFTQERDVAVVTPATYDDSRRITDLLRSNRAVVLATLDVDQSLGRRLVDFTAGTAYALNAKIEILIRGVYLVTPQGSHVGPEVKERLREASYRRLDQA